MFRNVILTYGVPDMIKELEITTRAFWSIVAIVIMLISLEMDFSWWHVIYGTIYFISIFFISIYVQYKILYLQLKQKLKNSKNKREFLNALQAMMSVISLLALLLIAYSHRSKLYTSDVEFLQSVSLFMTIYTSFASAVVAAIMTRRAFNKHGGF